MLTLLLVAILVLLVAGVPYEQLSLTQDALRLPPPGDLIDVGGHRLHLLCKGTECPGTSTLRAGSAFLWRLSDPLFAKQYPDSLAALVLVDTPDELCYSRKALLSLYSKFSWMMAAMSWLARLGLPRLVTRIFVKPDPSVPAEVSRQLNAAMVRREYFATASDDVNSIKRAITRLVKPDALRDLGDLPIAVITHGQPFPGPFAVVEDGWRDGQERLARLSRNSVFLVAEKSNHMI